MPTPTGWGEPFVPPGMMLIGVERPQERARRAVPLDMTSPSLRRDRRYEAKIPVVLLSVHGQKEVLTENISYRGLFLRTDLHLPTRELLRVRLTLPNERRSLETNIVIAFSRPGGCGAAFYGLDGEPRTRWEGFVESVRDQQSASTSGPEDEVQAVARRRRAGELVLAAASVPGFERLTRDLERGELVVHSPAALDLDANVSLHVVHPVTRSAFVVNGVVHRRLAGSGVSVKTSMDIGTRARLTDFVHSVEHSGAADIISDSGFAAYVGAESMRPTAPPLRTTMRP
jgi:hypothetical protein